MTFRWKFIRKKDTVTQTIKYFQKMVSQVSSLILEKYCLSKYKET